jgi:hypothetical protein
MKDFVRRVVRILAFIAQWAVALFLALIAITSASIAFNKRAVGLDTTAHFIAIAALAIVSVLLSPPAFFRLPNKARLASYALVIPAVVGLLWTFSVVNDAYMRTPQGAQEAKEEAAAAASRMQSKRLKEEQARREEEQRADSAAAEELARDVAAAPQEVAACINWRGQIPALTRRVKDSLHNPHSFEHVHTEMGTNPQGVPGVVMQYRAENGFGALRTEAVSALIEPDDCSVLAVQEYKSGDFGVE